MQIDISRLSETIAPKSDQANAEDFLTGARTVTITDIQGGNSSEQPVSIFFEGDSGRPYKPNKTYRRVLVFAWGEDGRNWIGRSMTLYCDPTVKFGGVEVGGICISHLSHIERPINISLTATRGKKIKHQIQVLETPASVTRDEVLKAIAAATDKPSMDKAKELAMQLTDEEDVQSAQTAYREKVQLLKNNTSGRVEKVEQ